MTLRDEQKRDRAWQDFLRKSWDADRLTRPVDLHRRWSYVTSVRLNKGSLVWQEAKPKRIGDHWVFDGAIARQAIVTRNAAEQAGRGILDEFLQLCELGDEAILQFAQTWGVLELCCHGLPACHEFSLGAPLQLPPAPKRLRTARTKRISDPRQCPPTGREPLATWRFFSSQARALLRVAADLRRSRLGRPEDWAILLRGSVTPVLSLPAQKRFVRDVLEGWLKLGRIKPTVDGQTIGLTWAGADLFGELAVQLALAAKALDGQVLCAACGIAYQPKRRVKRGGFNYCPSAKCRQVAAAARAKRYRDRKQSTKQKEHAGVLPLRGLFGGRTNDPLFSG